MKQFLTMSWECLNDQCRRCAHTWLSSRNGKLVRACCPCDCKHKFQKEFWKEQKKLGRPVTRESPDT